MFETQPCSGGSRRFGNLRGVQWRIDMGILPSSSSASVDDLRRVAADSRRRYAALRRQLLVDQHVPKDGSSSPDLVMDNPLSQNPDSMWGRFFRNAELERMVDQDLTRLYPEKGSYFQTSGCQGMLRRILLLWCLRHPEYGYRQGMHELLAPLLYVLHVDVERLSEVKKTYDDHFADKFDGFSFHENDLTYKFDFKKLSESIDDGDGFERSSAKASSLSKLDPEIKMIVLLSDAYGAEGELGIVLSEKFMEHDAYCMFDALMSGTGGAVVMAEFFSPPVGNSHTGFPSVIEASAALYHLLSIVDSSLHSHLVELGVEPQYFALRWLRVLFGREFSLEDLLVIWDETFSHENTKHNKAVGIDAESNFGVLKSARGAFICSFAVSMILNLRSSLLATENATTCLQRLLNFPDDVKLVKLIEKAKSLHVLAIDANNSSSLPIHPGLYDGRKPVIARGHRLSLDSTSLGTPLNTVPDSYWEEKWRVLHSEEKNRQNASGERVPIRRKGWSERVKLRLSRTESDPSPSKRNEGTEICNPAVRTSLLEDLERQLGSNEDKENTETGPFPSKENVIVKNSKSAIRRSLLEDLEHQLGSNEEKENTESDPSPSKENGRTKNFKPAVRRSLLEDLERQLGSSEHKEDTVFNEDVDHQDSVDVDGEDVTDKNNGSASSGAESEQIIFNFSYPTGPSHGNSDNETDRERISSAASNSSIDENDAESYGTMSECSPLAVSDPPDSLSSKCTENDDSVGKLSAATKEKKLIFGKFQWLWKFGRNAGDETSERISAPEDAKASNGGSDQNNVTIISTAETCKGETVDQNLMVSFKNLGQSMLENIQVIESVFQQDRGQTGSLENLAKNGLVGRGQGTAIAALKELRKISNLLSEM